MTEFLPAILETPTVGFTVLVGISFLYWLLVIFGAMGIDLFDGGADGLTAGTKGGAEAAAGALKGTGEAASGALKGASEAVAAALKGSGESAAAALKGAGEATTEAFGATKGLGPIKGVVDEGLLAALGLGKVPVTVSGSLVIFWGWVFSILGMNLLAPLLGFLPTVVTKGLVALLALAAGVLVASVCARPLHPVFVGNEAPGREELMGRLCTVSSGKVNARFGTASVEDGGAGLLLNVYCPDANALKKGDRALILGYDSKRQAYEVEPVKFLLPQELEALEDPTRAGEVLRAVRTRTR